MSLRDYGILPNSDVYSMQLGFADYKGDYLASELWGVIRERTLIRDNRRCVRCGFTASAVHHRTYTLAGLAGEADDQLVSLCEECHSLIHFCDDDEKRNEADWEAVLADTSIKRARKPILVGGKSYKIVRVISRLRHGKAERSD